MTKNKKKNRKPAFAATMQMAGKEATIDVSGVIGWDTKAMEFTDLVSQAKSAGCSSLTVRINSLGGYCSDGLAMGDALETCGMETKGVVIGTAQSMASYLLQCCNRRVAHKNATLMYHQPTAGAWGTVDEVAEQARALVQMRDTMFAKMAERCGMTGEELSREHLTMKIYTADEALAKGFLDTVDSAEVSPSGEPGEPDGETSAAHGSMLYDRREMLMAMLGGGEENDESSDDAESEEAEDESTTSPGEEKDDTAAKDEEDPENTPEAPDEGEKPLTRREVEQMLAQQSITMLAGMGAAIGSLPGTCAGGSSAEKELTDEQISRMPVMVRLEYLNTRPDRKAAYLRG